MRTLFAIILTLVSLCSIAQCPFQINNCKGKCPRFTDLNYDGYCDFTIITKPPVVDSTVIYKDTQSTQLLTSIVKYQHINKDSSSAKHSQTKIASTSDIELQNVDQVTPPDQKTDIRRTDSQYLKKQNSTSLMKKTIGVPTVSIYKTYPLFLISGLCIGLYLISFMLAKFKVIEIRIHRKIWNILLTTTFLVTGLLGLFMVIQLNYSLQIKWFKPLLTWHVSFGIGMALISIFHFLWHWSYVKKIFNFRPVKSNN